MLLGVLLLLLLLRRLRTRLLHLLRSRLLLHLRTRFGTRLLLHLRTWLRTRLLLHLRAWFRPRLRLHLHRLRTLFDPWFRSGLLLRLLTIFLTRLLRLNVGGAGSLLLWLTRLLWLHLLRMRLLLTCLLLHRRIFRRMRDTALRQTRVCLCTRLRRHSWPTGLRLLLRPATQTWLRLLRHRRMRLRPDGLATPICFARSSLLARLLRHSALLRIRSGIAYVSLRRSWHTIRRMTHFTRQRTRLIAHLRLRRDLRRHARTPRHFAATLLRSPSRFARTLSRLLDAIR